MILSVAGAVIVGLALIGFLSFSLSGSLKTALDAQETRPPATPTTQATQDPQGPANPHHPRSFIDDFSNPERGWPVIDREGNKAAYSQGGYLIGLDGKSPGLVGGPRLELPDAQLEVDAVLVSGEPGFAAFGLICQNDVGVEYYRLKIGVDRAAAIQRVPGESVTSLAFLPAGNSIVQPGSGKTNHY